MDTPTLRKKFEELEEQVAEYGGNNSTRPISSQTKLFILAGVATLAFLIIFRPRFLYIESPDGNDVYFSYQKLMLYWIIFTFLVVVGIFVYRYKQT